MILRMIATGSLSAFSSAALPELPSQSGRGGDAGSAVRQARAEQVPPPAQSAPQLLLDPAKLAAPSATGRVPPRGSLLDLSV